MPEGTMCALHTSVPAAHRCACCRGFMCGTCDFNLGGGLHVCPTCAMASATQGLGSRRKRNVIFGYALAAIATITLVLLMVGAFAPLLKGENGQFVAGVLISVFTFGPAAAGFGVASSAVERHLPNTFAIWGAIIWNLLIIASFMALTVIGLTSK
jgi:hypothetical protein